MRYALSATLSYRDLEFSGVGRVYLPAFLNGATGDVPVDIGAMFIAE